MQISLSNEQDALSVDPEKIKSAVAMVLADAGRTAGAVSLAVVDDPTIHRLNAQFLQHDYPTDVLSFALEDDGQRLEGEIIASAETAIVNAAEYDWPADHELLLYFLHGALHLVGYLDKTAEEAAQMRAAEETYLEMLGLRPPRLASENAAPGAPQQ